MRLKTVRATYLDESLGVLVLGCQTASYHVVRVDHSLHELPLDVAVGLIGRAYKRFTFFTINDVQKEREQQSDVTVAVLSYQQQEQFLVLTDGLTVLLYCYDILAYLVNDVGQDFLILFGI